MFVLYLIQTHQYTAVCLEQSCCLRLSPSEMALVENILEVRKYCSRTYIFIITKEKLGQVYPKNCEAFPQVTNVRAAFKKITD